MPLPLKGEDVYGTRICGGRGLKLWRFRRGLISPKLEASTLIRETLKTFLAWKLVSGIWGGWKPVRSDHSELGSTPKLNISVIVTPSDMEAEVLVACGTPERGIPPHMGHVSIFCGWVFLQLLVVLGATNNKEVVEGGCWGTIGVVLSPALHKQEV